MFLQKIFCLLFVPFFLVANTDYEKILKLVEQAKPSVLYAKSGQWRQTYEEIEKKAWQYLINFTDPQGIEESLQRFSLKCLGHKHQKVILKKIQSDIRGVGLSGSSVYQVLSEEGKPLIILKQIQFQEGMFLKEIAGMELVSSLCLQNLKTAKVLGIGYIENEGNKSYLIAESIAPGKNIDDYLIKLMMMSRVSLPRSKAFEDAKQMFFCLGSSLGEFHGAKEKSFAPIYPLFLQYCEHTVERGVLALRGNLHREDLASAVKKRLELLRDYMIDPGVRSSFMHGDAQFANYFYEEKSHTITIIDLPASSLSVAQSLSPIGSGIFDCAKIVEHLEMRTLFGLTQEEMEYLKSHFFQGYLASGRLPPAEYQMSFFGLVHDMDFIASYFDGIENRAWALNFAEERILKAKLKRLESTLGVR